MTSLSKVGFRLCPYDGDEGMWIAEREFRRHIRKCRQKYNGPLVTCMYNPRHLIGAPELFLHYQRDCQEKKHLDRLCTELAACVLCRVMLNDEAKGHIGTALGIGCDRETKNDIPSELILQAAAIDSGISLGCDETDFDDDQFVLAADASSDTKNAKSGKTAEDNFAAVMALYGDVPFGSEKPPDIKVNRDTADAADGGRQLQRADAADIWDSWTPTKNNNGNANEWKSVFNDYSHCPNFSRMNELDTWGDPPEDDDWNSKTGGIITVKMATLAEFAASEGLDESQLTPTRGLGHPRDVPKGCAYGLLESDFMDGNNAADADYELAVTEQQKEWEEGSH